MSIDIICLFVLTALIDFIVVSIILYYSAEVALSNPWISVCWVLFESLVTYYGLIRLIRCGILFILFSVNATILYTEHLTAVGNTVMESIGNGRIFSVSKTVLKNYLTDHNRITYMLINGNRQLFSAVLLTFFLTNIPVNIYLIRRIVLLKQDATILYLMWVVVLRCIQYSDGVFIGVFRWQQHCSHFTHWLKPAMYFTLRSSLFLNFNH